MQKTIRFNFIFLILLLAAGISQAAPAVDAGGVQRDIENLNNPKLPPVAPAKAMEQALPVADSNVVVKVTAFNFTGATRFDDATLQSLVANNIGQTLSYGDLNKVARKISQFYQVKGWLAKVYLPPQDIANGIVTIAINEAKLGKVSANGAAGVWLNQDFAKKMFTNAQGDALGANTRALERAMLLINDTPGFSGQATLSQGAESGETDVTLNLADRPIFNAKVWADNYGSRALGKARINGQVSFNDLTGYGDQLSMYALASRGQAYVQGGLSFPIGYAGTRMEFGGTVSNYDVVGAGLADLKANGESYSYHLGVKHPIIRSRFANLIFHSNLESLRAKDEVLGLQFSDKRYRSLTMGLNADLSDSFGLGGTFWGGVSVTTGDLDLSRNQNDFAADAISARSDGHYNKLNFYIGRQQILADKLTAKALLSAQLADTNLGGFEKFSLGGPSGLQGFTVGEAAADQGWMLNLEGKYTITPNWSASLLGDAGGVCINKSTWAGWNAANPNLRNCYQLASVGAGVGYSVQNIDAKLSYARQITGNPGLDNFGHDVEGASAKHQLWLQVGASF